VRRGVPTRVPTRVPSAIECFCHSFPLVPRVPRDYRRHLSQGTNGGHLHSTSSHLPFGGEFFKTHDLMDQNPNTRVASASKYLGNLLAARVQVDESGPLLGPTFLPNHSMPTRPCPTCAIFHIVTMPRTKSGLLTLFTYMAYADWYFCSLYVFSFSGIWFILYLVSMTMTYDTSQAYVVCLYVTCITIIDTIILNYYTNNAYIYYDTSQAV
jgi:hypothetical protein